MTFMQHCIAHKCMLYLQLSIELNSILIGQVSGPLDSRVSNPSPKQFSLYTKA